MVDEGALLAALGSILPDEPASPHPDELIIVRRMQRRRSSIYFVGLRDEAPLSRWVVKNPAPEVERLGIRPPISAEQQYLALHRLYEFLAAAGGRFVAPRPVALLPGLDALVMEFAKGRSLWELARPGALWRSQELVAGVREAALALRHVHTIEPPRVEPLDLEALQQSAFEHSVAALDGAGLPLRKQWFTPDDRPGGASAATVLLHGDWAPENVLLADQHVYCLDPELTDHGWPEHDIARFLLMLLDRSLFVATHSLRRSQKLRSEVTSTFLTAYYGMAPVSAVLQPLLMQEMACRWAVRHQDVVSGSSGLRSARTRLLLNYFSTVLDEVSDPHWADFAGDGDGAVLPR